MAASEQDGKKPAPKRARPYAPKHLHPTLADYLVIAVSPVLIMTLVGSLVYFLLEVFYGGDYEGRLRYIFTLFVIAAVLIGRISIESGNDRAALFAVPLAIATGLAIHRYVGSDSIVNWLLLGLIWWCTHRLTWDCTFLEESEDVSDEGLLHTIGQEPEGVTSEEATKTRWWQFWLDRRVRPNRPGVWIVYFSLAALPVFGFGQLLIPSENQASRQYVFWLLCIYVASGLALLMNTSLLGLRRYLRGRKLQMPAAMASIWMTLGSVLIAGLLVVAMLLPRPGTGNPLSQLGGTVTSPEQRPSRYALGKEGVRSDDAQRAGSHKQKAQENDRGKGETRDQPKDGKGSSEGKQDLSQGEQGGNQGSRQSRQGSSQGKQSAQSKQEPSRAGKGRSAQQSPSRPSPSPTIPQFEFSPVFQSFAPVLRWLLLGVLALAAVYCLWRARGHLVQMIAELLGVWKAFWQGLWGGNKRKPYEDAAEVMVRQPARPFSTFADPFLNGAAGRMLPEALVRYTFAALEAWAMENGCGRQAEETPHEFAGKVGERLPSLSREAWILADLYCRVTYAPDTLPAVTARPLEQLWRGLFGAPHRASLVVDDNP